MAQRRKRRTSIRTAAGTAQERLKLRARELKEDPTRILPECIGPEPAPLRRLRARLERIRGRTPGFFDRRDKEIVGAVCRTLPLVESEHLPRLLDARIEGNRRFFQQRGQGQRAAFLGVQNHDDPRALAPAFHPLAKRHGLHFFAMPRFWCTGRRPEPPEAWVEALGAKAGVALRREADDRFGCGHSDRARLLLRFPDGPGLAVCGPCGERGEHLHSLLLTRYIGPSRNRPVEILVLLPDGSTHTPEAEAREAYRKAERDAGTLLEEALESWRGHKEAAPGPRYVLGDRDLGDDQQAFLDELGAKGWERKAIAVLTRDGHAGREDTVAAVAEQQRDRLPEAVAALLGTGVREGVDFVAGHAGEPAREVLRKAHEERLRRTRVADLPELAGLGPVGAWMDATVRVLRGEGRAAALDRVRKALDRGALPPAHLYAFIEATGGALDLDVRFRPDEKDAGRSLAPLVAELLEASGDAYREALADYLSRSGSGEQVPG